MSALLPWQEALRQAANPEGEVVSGVWSWRKFIIEDSWLASSTELEKLLKALVLLGEEFRISAVRASAIPGTKKGGPASNRVVLVTWGEYLGMVWEEIYTRMNLKYAGAEEGESVDEPVDAQGSAEGSGGSATPPSPAGWSGRAEPPRPRQGL